MVQTNEHLQSLARCTVKKICIIKDKIYGEQYAEAMQLFEDKNYAEAKAIFETIVDYKDAQYMIVRCERQPEYDAAMKLSYEGNYAEATWAFEKLGDYEMAERSEDYLAEQQAIENEEVLKKVNVLSGGEKVRCMLSKMMLSGANLLMLDQPTDHLDVETITSLNEALINFKGAILFATHDHEFIETTANRIIDFKNDGKYIDKMTTYEEYLKLNRS